MLLYLLLCRYVHVRNLSVCLRDRWTPLNMLSLRAGLMISLALFCLICSSLHPKVTFVKDCNTYSQFSESVFGFLLVFVVLLFCSYLGVWSSIVLLHCAHFHCFCACMCILVTLQSFYYNNFCFNLFSLVVISFLQYLSVSKTVSVELLQECRNAHKTRS